MATTRRTARGEAHENFLEAFQDILDEVSAKTTPNTPNATQLVRAATEYGSVATNSDLIALGTHLGVPHSAKEGTKAGLLSRLENWIQLHGSIAPEEPQHSGQPTGVTADDGGAAGAAVTMVV